MHSRPRVPQPPKEKRVLPDPLPPIAPSQDELPPKPRGRGRPKKDWEDTPICCPFATADRENPCHSYADPVDKYKVNLDLGRLIKRLSAIYAT